MDRETTQRLLKESIIFLCRTYIGVVSDFEVDGIICISRDDGASEQQHVVFKIHELVSREANADSTYAECFGPELDFEGSGSLRTAGPWKRTSGSKKRKISNHLSCQNTFDYNKKSDNQLNYANSIPVFPELKLESPWPDELLKSNLDIEAISKRDFANVHRNKQVDGGDELPEHSCYGCELSFPTKKILDKHMLSVHELSAYCFCKTCGVGFIGTDDFDAHNLLVHPGCNNVAGMMAANDETDEAKPESNSPRADDFKSVISSSAIFPISSKNHQVARNCRPSSSNRISSASSVLVASGALDTNTGVLSFSPEEKPDAEDAIIDQSAPRSCALCDSGFSDFPAFNIHCKEVHNIFACPYCRKTFSQQSERDNHLFKHTGEKPFECPDCALSFSRLDSLRRHRMKIHGLSWADVVVPDSDSRQPDPSGNDDFDTVNDGRRSLENHLGGLTGVHPSNSSWMDGGSDAGERLFEVGRSYPGSCQSSDAIEISDEESCSRSTRNRYRNIKTLDPDRTFVCEICRETIQGTAAFRDHCDTVHRRVPCPYCGGTFTQKASMERHQRQHTGERPFRCQFCEHTYTRKENLQTHMLRLHPLLLDVE